MIELFIGNNLFGTIGLINTLLFSILVSLIMIKRKNIWLVSAIHSTWNFILGIVLGISVSGGIANDSILSFSTNKSKSLILGGDYGLEAGIVTTGILLVGILITTYKMKKKS